VRARRLSPTFAAFAYPRFRRIWAAGLISQLGDWMQIVGRSFLAYQLTGKAESVGLVYFATYLPQLLFSVWGGVLADRLNRRRLLIVTQIAQALGAAGFGVLAATGTATVANIAGLSFVLGIGFMLAIPAAQALAPTVVPRSALTSAINLGTTTNSITRVFGPLLASLVIAGAGVEWVFWANAASFLAVIVAWLVTPVPPQPAMEEERSLDAIGAAVRYVRRTPAVAVPIGATSFLMVVGLVYQPLAIVYATRVLADGAKDLGQTYYGWSQAGVGVGAAIGILAFAGAGRRRPAATFVATAIAFSAALTALGLTSTFAVAMAILVMIGAFHFANLALAINLVQHEVPEVMRGRVMSIHMTGLVGVVPITALVSSLVADQVGIRATFTGAGLICVVFSLLLLRWSRHIRVYEVEAESPEARAAVGRLIEEEA